MLESALRLGLQSVRKRHLQLFCKFQQTFRDLFLLDLAKQYPNLLGKFGTLWRPAEPVQTAQQLRSKFFHVQRRRHEIQSTGEE